jgi:hypothetical protein
MICTRSQYAQRGPRHVHVRFNCAVLDRLQEGLGWGQRSSLTRGSLPGKSQPESRIAVAKTSRCP